MTTPSLHQTTQENNTFNRLVAHLWRGSPWGYLWTPDGEERIDKDGKPYRQKPSRWQPTTRPIIVPAAWADKNVYFCVNPCSAIPTTFDNGNPARPHQVRGRMPHVGSINTIFAEYDIKPGQYADQAAIMTQLESLPMFPTVLIHSGGGVHAYWLLEHTVMLDDTNRDHWKQLQKAWVKFAKGDAVKDLTRVLRVAGSRNMKEHFKPDYPTVRVITEDNCTDFRRLYTPWHFETATASIMSAMDYAEQRAREEDQERTGTAGGAAEGLLEKAVRDAHEGGRHEIAVRLAVAMHKEGIAKWAITENLKDFARRVNTGTGRKIDDAEVTKIAAWAETNA